MNNWRFWRTETRRTMTRDVLVMGGGATGQLAAAYLRKRFPNLKVTVVEGPRENRPIVGESLVEVSVDFLFKLGLGAYLVEKHYPKYGLTYYFKPDIDNPADRVKFRRLDRTAAIMLQTKTVAK